MSVPFAVGSGADASRIVDLLRKYQKPLPSGFIASILGKNEEELDETIQQLKDRSVVKLNDGLLELQEK